MLCANNDEELSPWLFGIIKGQPTKAGGFLTAVAEAAFRGDMFNYQILRPALLELKKKYPNYKEEPLSAQEPKQHQDNR